MLFLYIADQNRINNRVLFQRISSGKKKSLTQAYSCLVVICSLSPFIFCTFKTILPMQLNLIQITIGEMKIPHFKGYDS